jgi:diacylglycerol kinase family enzyme
MRVLLVVNPFASSVTARVRVVIAKALSSDHEVTVVETSRRGHATRFARDAAARGFDAVAVLGGDGTLNEAANGLAGSPCALAALPGGSTNVFARTLGYPNDPVEATGVLVESLAADRTKRIGLGSVNGRYFLFHVGIGFDAAVVREVERRGGLKRWAGHPLFMYAGMSTWAKQRRHGARPFNATIGPSASANRADRADSEHPLRGVFAICLNTNPYTYLGNRPLNISAAASLDRALVLVLFRDLAMRTVAPALGSALRGRPVRETRHLAVRTDVTEVTLVAETAMPYQVDGDDLGDASRLTIRHEPDALNIVLPGPAARS